MDTRQLPITNLTDRRRIDRLYAIADTFALCPELLKQVYWLGRPHFTDSISTAAVTVTRDGDVIFEFNRRFFDRLSDTSLAFVVLHEVLHVAFRHHVRRQERIPLVWDIACDAAVNAFLLDVIGFAQICSRDFQQFIRAAVTLANLGFTIRRDDHCRMSAEEIYEWLLNNSSQLNEKALALQACDDHRWPDSADGSSNDSRTSTRRPQKDCEEPSEPKKGHGSPCQGRNCDDALAACLDELGNEVHALLEEWLPAWGNTALGEVRAVAATAAAVPVDWDYVLSCRIASCLYSCREERWAPAHRKIAWLYPAVLLPAEQESQRWRSSVLMAIDASGSVSGAVLARLLAVARSLPGDRVELTTVSFDTEVYDFDLDKKLPRLRGGGGTCFDAIENHMRTMHRYPDLVVVLSDGYAPRPTVRHPQRWFWLITAHGTTRYIEGIGRYVVLDNQQPPQIKRTATEADSVRPCLDEEIPF